MKKFCIILALALAALSSSQESLRYTALGLSALDIYQTNTFMRGYKPTERWNPLVRGLVEHKDHLGFTLVATGSVFGIDAAIRSMPKKSRTVAYIAWIVVEFAATYANSRRAGAIWPLMRLKF